MSLFGGKATRLVAVVLSGRAVVASFASAALGWRLAAAFRGVVVVERVRQVVELACLVVGEPGGATVGRARSAYTSRLHTFSVVHTSNNMGFLPRSEKVG